MDSQLMLSGSTIRSSASFLPPPTTTRPVVDPLKKKVLDIPRELHIEILSNLDVVSLVRCAMTCKTFYSVYKASSLLEYIVQLHLDGLKHTGTHITESHSKCLQRLYIVDVTFTEGGPARFQEFSMDPSQDMVVGLVDVSPLPQTDRDDCTYHVYIRTISSNTAHPRAAKNPLRFVVEKDREMSVFNAHIEIARDNLLVHICTCDMETDDCVPSVLIWNWTTAEAILDTSNVSVDLPNMSPWPEFGLLDSTFCYIISLNECGALWLCKLCPSCDPPIVHIATLHFPPTTPETEVYKIIGHAGPLEAHAPPNMPFMVNDDDRLHMFTMSYSNPLLDYRDKRRMLTLYVHQRVFSKYAFSELNPGHLPINIPWAEWGPENTRIVYPACFVPQVYEWTRFVHGQRVVFSPSPTSDIVDVLDFSLAAVLTATGALPTTSLSTSSESPMAMGLARRN